MLICTCESLLSKILLEIKLWVKRYTFYFEKYYQIALHIDRMSAIFKCPFPYTNTKIGVLANILIFANLKGEKCYLSVIFICISY